MEEILAAIRAGELAEVIAALLRLWRRAPAAQVADAIDRATERLLRQPSPRGTVEERQRAWFSLDVPAKLATFAEIKRGEILEQRVAALAALPPDPRIAMRLATLVVRWPIPGATGVLSLQAALDLIAKTGDVRTAAVLMTPYVPAVVSAASKHLTSHLSPCIIAVRERAPVAAPPGIAEVIAALAPEDTATPEALWAAVYANPDDDQPRVVLADYLQRIGDPRGEFIAMQLAGKRTKSFDPAWVGPIMPMLKKTRLVFERGFLSRCAAHNPMHGRTIILAREWATVTDLDIRAWPALAHEAALLASMTALRTVRGAVSAIAPHPTLEKLVIDSLSTRDLAQLVQMKLPALRTLELRSLGSAAPSEWKAFWTSALAQQLQSVALGVNNVAAWFLAVRGSKPPDLQLSSYEAGWGIQIVGGTASVYLAHAHVAAMIQPDAERLALERLIAERDPA
ncbi:MAG TPA: TIGR02996 domain-containing protein [Kofleriaceae bacterium]